MEKTKILHAITDKNIGGAGIMLKNLIEELTRLGNTEHSVILPKDSLLIPYFKGVCRVIPLKMQEKSFSLYNLYAFSSLLQNEKYDILHTHAAISARIASKLIGKEAPCIMTRHCTYPQKHTSVKKLISKAIIEKVTDLYIASADAASNDLRNIGISNSKIITVTNGVPPAKKITAAKRSLLLREFSCEGFFVAGIAARLEKEKGIDTVLRAAETISHVSKKIRFLIFGKGSLENELKRAASKLENVIFCGFRENVTDYMNIFNVLINSSVGTETSCLAISEAMSLSVPVIATDFGGNPEMLKFGGGMLFPAGNADKLAEAILKVYYDRHLCDSLASEAYRAYLSHRTIEEAAKKYENIYINIINS